MAERDEVGAVVFQQREVMEEAVRALIASGVSPTRIRVAETEGSSNRLRLAAERGSTLTVGVVVGTIAGTAVALSRMMGLARRGLLDAPVMGIFARALGGAVAGAVAGALIALVVGLLSRPRLPVASPSSSTHANEFIVSVRAEDEGSAAHAHDVLLHYGGNALA